MLFSWAIPYGGTCIHGAVERIQVCQCESEDAAQAYHTAGMTSCLRDDLRDKLWSEVHKIRLMSSYMSIKRLGKGVGKQLGNGLRMKMCVIPREHLDDYATLPSPNIRDDFDPSETDR